MTGSDLRIEIVAGGRPDAATTAAIGMALRSVLTSRRDADTPSRTTSGWRRAALREGVGGRPEVGPDGRG